jgi:hypothetical protein
MCCFQRPHTPPTNNQAERSLRPVMLMRRVIQGTRSAQGLENHSVLRRLCETARRQGKMAHRFLQDLFTLDPVTTNPPRLPAKLLQPHCGIIVYRLLHFSEASAPSPLVQ